MRKNIRAKRIQRNAGPMIKNEVRRITISKNIDVIMAVTEAKILSEKAGFKKSEQFMVATAVSELARNIYRYAKTGKVTIKIIGRKNRKGIEVIAEDHGPGIKDVEKVLQDGYSTSSGSLGIGLSGAKRLMDEFLIDTEIGRGTKIKARKWV